MSRLIKVEIIKLTKSLAFKIIAGLIVLTVALNLGIYAAVKIMDIPEVTAILEATGGLEGYTTFKSLMASPSGDVMLFTVILLCILIGGDFSSKTLQGQIVAGYSRMKVSITRFITGMIVFGVFSFIYIGANTVGMSIMFGFGEKFTVSLFGEMVVRILLHILASAMMISLYWLIIMAMKNTGASIGVCLPTLLVGSTLIEMLALFFEKVGKIIDWTPFGAYSVPSEELLTENVVRLLVVSVLTLVFSIGLNYLTFKKAELK